MEIDSGREKKKLKGAWTRADADRDGFVTHKEFVESVVDGEAIAGRLKEGGREEGG